jgi:hypothetical protein
MAPASPPLPPSLSVTSPATTLTVQSLRDGVLPRSWSTCTLSLSHTNSLMKDDFNYVKVLLQFPSWKPVNGFYPQRAGKHPNSQKLVSSYHPFVSICDIF